MENDCRSIFDSYKYFSLRNRNSTVVEASAAKRRLAKVPLESFDAILLLSLQGGGEPPSLNISTMYKE